LRNEGSNCMQSKSYGGQRNLGYLTNRLEISDVESIEVKRKLSSPKLRFASDCDEGHMSESIICISMSHSKNLISSNNAIDLFR